MTLGCQLQRQAGTHKGAGAGWSACQMVLAAAVGNHELQRGGSRSAGVSAAALLRVSTVNEGSYLAGAWDISDSVRSR